MSGCGRALWLWSYTNYCRKCRRSIKRSCCSNCLRKNPCKWRRICNTSICCKLRNSTQWLNKQLTLVLIRTMVLATRASAPLLFVAIASLFVIIKDETTKVRPGRPLEYSSLTWGSATHRVHTASSLVILSKPLLLPRLVLLVHEMS